MDLFLLLTVVLACLLLCFPLILHRVYRAPRIIEQSTPAALGMNFSEQWLSSVNGKQLFSWFLPANNSRCTLVIVHGWGANAEMMLPLAQPFYAAGMDVLLYDARNHGRSDRDSFSSLPRFAEDLGCALDWLQQRSPGHQLVVLGHSLGAAAAILSASRRHDIDLVIGLSGFAHPNLLMKRHLDKPWLPRFMRTQILNYIQHVIGFRFEDIAPMNRISELRCPVLLAHGTEDKVVPISDMQLIQQNATDKQSMTIMAVEGAQHDSIEHFHDQSDKLLAFIQQKLSITPLSSKHRE
ncbi:alpha/beta hydrolase [Agarivorans sp. QJM3NY_33]|uniref:alpha/beta hydrolase n=1 Tax=Agarivorans sp. QJM3NY_33 TaxID=3421432 RepID=UPI003D7D107C